MNRPRALELRIAALSCLGDASNEILRRLLPFLQAAFKRVRIELPVDRIRDMLAKK